MKLEGSIVALITPFRKGRVDQKTLSLQIEFQITHGTNGLVPCGTTGESPTLTHEEHKKVIAIAVKAAKGRVPVIAGTGSNSTEEAVELSRHAKKVGADAILSVVPYYNKPTQAGLYAHFKTIASKCSLPMILYNIPGRCSVGLSIETITALAKIKNIVGIKEATGLMDQASQIISKTGLTVLSGDDSLTLPLMSLGAKGVISVFANIFPADVAFMVHSYLNGDTETARCAHFKMFPLFKSLFVETNPIPVKTAMKLKRMDSGELRLPLTPMAKGNLKMLKAHLAAYPSRRTFS